MKNCKIFFPHRETNGPQAEEINEWLLNNPNIKILSTCGCQNKLYIFYENKNNE
jgi:hypothetical protein